MDFRSVESNLRDSFRVLASHRPSGEVLELPGVTIASSAVAFQMFNAAFLSAPVESEAELRERIERAAAHFESRRREWAYWVCEGWLGVRLARRAPAIFRKCGLHLSVELPGMAAPALLPPARPLPRMEIRRVQGHCTRDAFCAVGSTCFNVPLHWFCEVFEGNEAVWRDFASYVGYVDGQPVSTAAAVTGSGVIGIYNVATLAGCQRRGYAEAIVRHAVESAGREHGITGTILQSTPQGLELYKRMGYRTVTSVSVYSS